MMRHYNLLFQATQPGDQVAGFVCLLLRGENVLSPLPHYQPEFSLVSCIYSELVVRQTEAKQALLMENIEWHVTKRTMIGVHFCKKSLQDFTNIFCFCFSEKKRLILQELLWKVAKSCSFILFFNLERTNDYKCRCSMLPFQKAQDF